VQAVVPPAVPKRTGFDDLDAFLLEIRRKLETPDVQQQLLGLSEIYFKFHSPELERLDPFSDCYRDKVIEFYRRVTGHSHYDALTMEKTDAAENLKQDFTPIPYRFQNSDMVGEYLSCYGWVLRNLKVHAGADVLEYGPGEGQLSIHLARMGCNVCAIDIEQRFLDLIQQQCRALGTHVTTQLGRFGDGIGDRRFDRVVFFEAFHHCFDHYNVLLRIRELLKPDGFICFSGEPVIPPDSPNSILVPYPWGLRLDGESMRSISEFGWMELGHSEPYFLELLARCGYSVERSCHGVYARADAYIARKITSRYPIERDTVISTYLGHSGWHASEGIRRWTDGDAWMPLPVLGFKSASITVQNMGPKPLDLEVSCDSDSHRARLNPGEESRKTLALSAAPGNLRIRSGTFRPTSGDTRTLGVAVKAIEFA